MAEPSVPRTLLEALVRQRQLSWDEAADLVVKTAKKHEDVLISLSGRHLGRLASTAAAECDDGRRVVITNATTT